MEQTMGIVPPTRGNRQAGGVLAILLFAVVPVIALIAALSTRQIQEGRSYQGRLKEQTAIDRALSGLEIARSLIINSTYQAGRNDILHLASLQVGVGSLRPHKTFAGQYVAFNTETGAYVTIASPAGQPAHIRPFRLIRELDLVDNMNGEADDINEKVRIYAAPIVGIWHILECEAHNQGMTRTARTFVRERDPFSRYSIFVNKRWLNLGSVPDGPVHCNRGITFQHPEKNFAGFVSATEGFYYAYGADPSNVIFSGGSAAYADPISMPTVNEIAAVGAIATGSYRIGSDYSNVRITLDRETVTIVATELSTGTDVTLLSGAPLPSNGVIYAEGPISGLSGDLNGRLTIATPSTATITGNLRYVDDQGQPRQRNPNNPAEYEPNPAYTGNSALGIIAGGNLSYGSDLPDRTEINAACFTGGSLHLPGMTFDSSGDWTRSYDGGFVRPSMCFLGSTIVNQSATSAIIDSSSGNHIAGFQVRAWRYDWELLNNPPPHFLAIDRPMFRGIEMVQDRMGTETLP